MNKDIIGVDLYNCAVTNGKTSTIRNSAADSEHIPTVIEKVISMTTDSFMKTDDKTNKSFTLLSRDYKDPQCVSYGIDRAAFNQGENAQYDFSIVEEQQPTMVAKGPGGVAQKMFWDGSQTCSTLTRKNAGGGSVCPIRTILIVY